METPSDLYPLVDQFAARIEALNLGGDAQEEYSTFLHRLEDQADRLEPNWDIVEECLVHLRHFEVRAA